MGYMHTTGSVYKYRLITVHTSNLTFYLFSINLKQNQLVNLCLVCEEREKIK